MKTEDLLKVWNAPDNSRLTPKQMSIRLPIHVSASISAFAEMYPRKTKTEIIGDLLATAIDEFVKALAGDTEDEIEGQKVTIPGELNRFTKLKQKYLEELEEEIGKNKTK